MIEVDKAQLVHTVESEREKLLFHKGEGFAWESLPLGSRVVYSPPPLPGFQDVKSEVRRAIENPTGSDPLPALLHSGMKVTIAIDDLSLPLPPMSRPDIRQQVLEVLIPLLEEKGVSDYEMVWAIALHRKMTPGEIRHAVGRRIFNRYYPDRLYNMDAEDPEGNVEIGETERGEVVELNRRAVESDLLIYVNICLTAMDGGHKSASVGLATYRSIKCHHNHHLLTSSALMDPEGKSVFHESIKRMGKVLADHVKIFTIETVVNTAMFPSWLPFLKKQEKNYNLLDRTQVHFNLHFQNIAPYEVRRRIFQAIRAPYGVVAVNAGATDPVHATTLESIYRQQEVPVQGQCDVMIVGVPYLGPYNVNSIMNPILVHSLAHGYCFNMYRNKPLVREGGVFILFHPLEERFNAQHHPSYIEFYEKVLPETRDMQVIREKYEEHFATDPRYIDLYRNNYAYHGFHALSMWYWGAAANAYLGKTICVKPNNERVAERMGYEHAGTLQEALARAESFLGKKPEVAYFHMPPIFVANVQ